MSNTIKLPSMPATYHESDIVPITETELRARDLEIARCVLEAAAKFTEQGGGFRAEILANAIRALEFHHE